MQVEIHELWPFTRRNLYKWDFVLRVFSTCINTISCHIILSSYGNGTNRLVCEFCHSSFVDKCLKIYVYTETFDSQWQSDCRPQRRAGIAKVNINIFLIYYFENRIFKTRISLHLNRPFFIRLYLRSTGDLFHSNMPTQVSITYFYWTQCHLIEFITIDIISTLLFYQWSKIIFLNFQFNLFRNNIVKFAWRCRR